MEWVLAIWARIGQKYAHIWCLIADFRVTLRPWTANVAKTRDGKALMGRGLKQQADST